MTVFELRGFIFHDIHQKDEEGVRAIDFFSLCVLFSQHRSCDSTLENCFFLIISYSRHNYAQSYGPSIRKTKHTSWRSLFGLQNAKNMRWENILAHARLWHESTQIEYWSQKMAQKVWTIKLDCQKSTFFPTSVLPPRPPPFSLPFSSNSSCYLTFSLTKEPWPQAMEWAWILPKWLVIIL